MGKEKETKQIPVLNRNNLIIHKLVDKKNAFTSILAGVHITDDYTEVTDGHYAIRVGVLKTQDTELPPDGVGMIPIQKSVDIVVSADRIKRIEGSLPKHKHMPYIDQLVWIVSQDKDNGKVGFGAYEEHWNADVIEGRFPDFESVRPEGDPVIELSFNAEFMQKLCDVLKKVSVDHRNDKSVKMTIYGAEKPIVLEATNKTTNQKIEAFLMPIGIK